MVVNDIGKVVGRHAVALEEHLVVQQIAVHSHIATNEVVDSYLCVGGKFETHHIMLSALKTTINLVSRKAEAVLHHTTSVAVILEGLLLSLIFFTLGLKFLRFVKGIVGPTIPYQLVGILLVHRLAVALTVRAVGTSYVDTFVKLDTQPCKSLDDIVFGAGHKACLVGVLDTENHLAAILFCKEIIIKGCANTADVQRSRRTWSKSYSNFL